MQNLDDGDLKHTVDFKSVYVTVLNRWPGANDKVIPGQRFEKFRFL